MILVGDGIYLDGGKPQEIGDQYASDGSDNVIVLLLKKDSEHYFAVMNKKNLIIQKEKLAKLKEYVQDKTPLQPGDEMYSKQGHEMLQTEILELKKRMDMLEKILKQQTEEIRVLKGRQENDKEMMEIVDDDENVVQCRNLDEMKTQGSVRVSPQTSPVKKKTHNECDRCQIQFISKDILDRHNIQYHHVNDLDKVNKQDKETSKSDNNAPAQHDKIGNNISVVTTVREEYDSGRPNGIVTRQDNNDSRRTDKRKC